MLFPLFEQPFRPKLHMTEADFQGITRGGRLCDPEGGIGCKEFELVMREQVFVCVLACECVPLSLCLLCVCVCVCVCVVCVLKINNLCLQVRQYTLQSLSIDPAFMTPEEEARKPTLTHALTERWPTRTPWCLGSSLAS